MRTIRPILFSIALGAVVAPLASCSSMYYSAMESVGLPKRDLVVKRVAAARDSQEDAKEQFKTALDEFTAVLKFDGGDLQKRYNSLNSEFEDCESRAEDVRERVKSIENVSQALFKEWEAELEQYKSADLRRSSEKKLRYTRARYDQLIGAMHKAESKMDPVLDAFRDQVLFLKHNLNAQAIASLDGERISLEKDVSSLVAEMEQSINAANSFIEQMKASEGG